MIDKFPAGNGKVGDEVWLKQGDKQWRKDFKITSVGKPNTRCEHKHCAIMLVNDDRKKLGVSCFGGLPDYKVYIFPPLTELPEKLKKALRSSMRVIRDPNNGEEARYSLLCVECESVIRIEQTADETSDLRFDTESGTFYQGKPCIVDGNTRVCCNCRGYDIEFASYS